MHDPFSTSSAGSRNPFGSFGTKTQDLETLLHRASKIAQDMHQEPNIAHVLVAAFDPEVGPLPTPLDTIISERVRQAWYRLASDHVDGGGTSPKLDDARMFARGIAGSRALSAALMIYAIAETNEQARKWLVWGYETAGSGSASDLQVVLKTAAADSIKFVPIVIDSGQFKAEVQQWLLRQKMSAAEPYTFAHAHSAVLRSIATEVDMRGVRGVRIPLIRGPRGSGIERIARALAEAPEAGLPLSWMFKDTYALSVASLLARKDARDFLETVVEEVGVTGLLVLTDAREFDRAKQHEQRAQECIDYLAAETPTNVILVYPTDDNGSMVGTSLRRATFQDVTLDPLLKVGTQTFVQTYFWKYWEVVDNVSVAHDAFDDVYPVSPFIYEDDVHYNLPYLPIVLGSNAALTVKGGREAVVALVEAAQTRLNAAREAIRPNKSLTDTFARYFVTLQMELDALRANPEPSAKNGMLLVTRELVSAELAASPVYVFKWPEIEAMGRMAPIAPEPYPRP